MDDPLPSPRTGRRLSPGEMDVRSVFDAGWRAAALAGNRAAIAELAQASLQPLYGFCYYRVGRDRHLCEEVVQSTLLRALRDLTNYDPSRAGNNVFPWLSGLARNEIQRTLAKEGNARSLEALWERMDKELLAVYAQLDAQPFADEVLQREETREMVNATMSQLPPHYRETLEAKYLEGKSVRAIALAQRTTEKAVESQLTRARNAFRATFLALARNLTPEPV
jgi:RNA polymerase sigma factor (sigma-70 family)